ncbi:MAG: hypothetical protein JO311_07445 [Candidatus Eremiobacteraeota bacterium]|nr:hypothetical protein [Candidatus Eremiobacteraeota bacterium]
MCRIGISAAALCLCVAACAQRGGVAYEPQAPPAAIEPLGATSYRLLYSFGEREKSGDGVRPVAALHAIGGTFYGTTQQGGTRANSCSFGCGTVFRISPAGVESIVYRFSGGIDGMAPASRLVTLGGALAGTTQAGGAGTACYGGCGTVFRVNTDGTKAKVLYAFTGGHDGAVPLGGLTVAGTLLYGTTEYGGKRGDDCLNGCGTVYSLHSDGSNERILHRFAGGSDGANPLDTLLDVNGSLYGTTMYGGTKTTLCSHGCGTVFRVDAAGTEKILYRFRYALKLADAAYPVAGLLFSGGLLYGTTLAGGTAGLGTVFVVNPSSGKERVLHSFVCCSKASKDGAYPAASLAQAGGALYGTTRGGGANGHGTVFEITAGGKEGIVYNFGARPDGNQPDASLLLSGTELFGTTAWGGRISEGSVFRLTP